MYMFYMYVCNLKPVNCWTFF